MPTNWPKPGPITEVGPKLPKINPVTEWPKPKPGTNPYIKRQRKDGNPDESGDRAK
ncbi:hypothetical protein ACFLVZ_00650 [Chloroflexota bacterium]